MKVVDILLTESSEGLRSLHVDIVGSLTGRAKLTDTLEVVLADVKLVAVGFEPAGTVLTVALIVMWADLEECTEDGDHIMFTQTSA